MGNHASVGGTSRTTVTGDVTVAGGFPSDYPDLTVHDDINVAIDRLESILGEVGDIDTLSDEQLTQLTAILAKLNASIAITVASLPLPSGASTGGKQDTGNASLSSIDGKVPALGQAIAAASIPVVLPAAQVTTLTPLAQPTDFPSTGTNTRLDTLHTDLSHLTDGTEQIIGNVASATTDSGNPVKTGGKYNATPPTFTDGQRGNHQIDVNGNAKMVEQYAPVYEDNVVGVAKVEQRFGYQNITTAATTTIKSGAGMLHLISVNTKGTVASTIKVYDNTAGSGTLIATIDSLNLSGSFRFDVLFNTGLTLVTTGTVAPDITVSFR